MSHNYDQLRDCFNWLRDCGFTSDNLRSVVTTIPENFAGHVVVTFTRFDLNRNKAISKDYCFTPEYRNYVIFETEKAAAKSWRNFLYNGYLL